MRLAMMFETEESNKQMIFFSALCYCMEIVQKAILRQPVKTLRMRSQHNMELCRPRDLRASLPFNTVVPPEPPEDYAIKRCSKKRSTIEDVHAKLAKTTRKPLHHEEKRKSQRRKNAIMNSLSSEDTDITVANVQKVVIASLPSSSSNASTKQRTNQERNDGCTSRKSNEEQISGRRSLSRAAEKVVSYKEIPLNVKMR